MTCIDNRVRIGAAAALSLFLLPPAASGNVVISARATQNMSCSAGTCSPTAQKAVLNAMDLANLLAAGNVAVTTSGAGVQAGNIQIDAALAWSTDNGLTLDAYRSIRVEKPVTISGTGSLSIVTNDGGTGGTFSFGSKGHVTFSETSSALSIDGTPYALIATLPALASAIAADPSGFYALSQNYDSSQDGKYRASPIPTTFEGNFNGLGNTISKLRILDKGEDGVGLFSEIDASAMVSSIRMSAVQIETFRGNADGSAVGMLVGSNRGTITNSIFGGRIQAKSPFIGDFGGIAGYNYGTINQTASTVAIEVKSNGGDNAFVGGISGVSSGTISQSYSAGPVTVEGASGSDNVGALLGANGGTLDNCYATGSASGHAYVGGLVGLSDSLVTTSYSTGIPTAGPDSYVGGLVGYDDGDQHHDFKDTYWDTTTSGITNLSQGAGNIANDPGIKGETTAQLQAGLPKGFDRSVWAESPTINGGLPYLIDNPPQK
jgi:hypothetical protein